MESGSRGKKLRKLGDLMDSSRRERWRKLRIFMDADDPDMHSYRQKLTHSVCSEIDTPSPSTPELGDDILTEILYRLPAKSASRFKCVSKRWLGLIDTRVLERQPRLLVGLFYQHCCIGGYEDIHYTPEHKRVQFVSICCSAEEEREMIARGLGCLDESLGFLPQPVYIRGCRHGLLLCTRTKLNPNQYYVCNPITNQFVALPEPKICETFAATGFFVDEEDGHYQVVRIPLGPYSNPMDDDAVVFVEAFSSVTSNWRVSKFTVASPRVLPYEHGAAAVQLKGRLYWVDTFSRIIVYNIKEDRLSTFHLPDCEGTINFAMVIDGCLGESGGLLRFLFNDGHTVRAWVLQECHWELVQTVLTYSIKTKLFPYTLGSSFRFGPIGFHSLDPEVVFFTFPGRIFSYHFASKRVEMLTSFDLKLQLKPETVFPCFLPQQPFPVAMVH